jgi:hypothetical protein
VKSTLGILVLAIGLCSCTNEQVYDSVQNSNKLECDKLQTVQREECLKRLAPEYSKYEAEREKLLKKKD